MKNPFKNNPLSLDELVKWKNDQSINPRTGCKILETGSLYKLINKAYQNNKVEVDKLLNQDTGSKTILTSIPKTKSDIVPETKTKKHKKLKTADIYIDPIDCPVQETKLDDLLDPNIYLIDCHDDRDPISMNIFWVELNGQKQIVYPSADFDQLVLYRDSKNSIRCFEKESLKYLKTYEIKQHPISCDEIPDRLFEGVNKLDIVKIQNDKTLENMALDVFQYFSKISIFVNYESFLGLNKNQLIKFNYELRDFWIQNFSKEQKNEISQEKILYKEQSDMESDSLENIQKYLLGQLKILLKCEKEEHKYMINYVILGALGIVIPEIKEMYPDFSFSFC